MLLGQPAERHFSHHDTNFVLHSKHPAGGGGCHGGGIGKDKSQITPPIITAKISTIKRNFQLVFPWVMNGILLNYDSNRPQGKGLEIQTLEQK